MCVCVCVEVDNSNTPSPSTKQLESAFKFKSLQSDPLHGGDQESFDRVHEAYNMLIQLKKHREEDKKHILVHYSGDIKKGPPGEGENR